MTVCVLAVWRGADEERLAAAGILANWALSMVVFRAASEDTQWAVFFIDAALTALYLWIAMRSLRYWPLFAAGLQILVMVTHIGHAVDARVSGWAYLTVQLAWSYLILLTIGYASWTAPRRYAEIAAELSGVPGAIRR